MLLQYTAGAQIFESAIGYFGDSSVGYFGDSVGYFGDSIVYFEGPV